MVVDDDIRHGQGSFEPGLQLQHNADINADRVQQSARGVDDFNGAGGLGRQDACRSANCAVAAVLPLFRTASSWRSASRW